VLTIALNYGARWDIANAARQIASGVLDGKWAESEIDEGLLARHLSTADLPDPDLFIRTGGELRLSNFLLWQLAYTELYFTETLWPDFGEDLFNEALSAYGRRQRRYGQTGDQIAKGAG